MPRQRCRVWIYTKTTRQPEQAAFLHRKEQTMEAIKLETPYVFEDKEYTEIDLTGLEKLKVKDAIAAQMKVMQNPSAVYMLEYSSVYAMQLAAMATGKPLEFYQLMPVGLAKKVRGAVANMVVLTSQSEGGKLKLDAPCTYKGKTYSEVDLSGAAQLNTMDVINAENRLAAENHVAPEPGLDYLYCVIMAARASGMDEEFFAELPIKEAAKIKAAVNGSGFFG